MMLVIVRRLDMLRKIVDTRYFDQGQWQDIGYWLDEAGYNLERYAVTITFADDPAGQPGEGVSSSVSRPVSPEGD